MSEDFPFELAEFAHVGLGLGHAMAEVAADHAGENWKEIAFEAFVNHASRHETFTTEQVRRASVDVPAPPDLRAWGQVALRARREGIVVGGGWVRADSPTVHGMVVTRWTSNICGALNFRPVVAGAEDTETMKEENNNE